MHWDHYTDLDVYHTSEPLNAELMVDGFPARVDLSEKEGPYLYNDSGWQFVPYRTNRDEVSVHVGSARLVFKHEWERDYEREPVATVSDAGTNAVGLSGVGVDQTGVIVNRSGIWWPNVGVAPDGRVIARFPTLGSTHRACIKQVASPRGNSEQRQPA